MFRKDNLINLERDGLDYKYIIFARIIIIVATRITNNKVKTNRESNFAS